MVGNLLVEIMKLLNFWVFQFWYWFFFYANVFFSCMICCSKTVIQVHYMASTRSSKRLGCSTPSHLPVESGLDFLVQTSFDSSRIMSKKVHILVKDKVSSDIYIKLKLISIGCSVLIFVFCICCGLISLLIWQEIVACLLHLRMWSSSRVQLLHSTSRYQLMDLITDWYSEPPRLALNFILFSIEKLSSFYMFLT